MTSAFGPALSRYRARAIRAGRRLIRRFAGVAAGLTRHQPAWLAVLPAAAIVAMADAVCRAKLHPFLHPLVPFVLFTVAAAVLLRNGARLWSPLKELQAPLPEALIVAIDPVAQVVPAEPDTRPSAAVLDRSIGELAQFPIFTDILTSQMASVVALSDGAAQGIMTGLAQVDSEVTTLMSMIRTSDAGVEVGDIVAGIEIKVAACGRLLEHFTTRQAESCRLDAALRVRLEAESQAVLRIVAGVRRIAQQSNILSFNIAIEAGHLGTKDNGFSFIADQVRRLAQDVDALAGQLSSQLGDLMHSVIVESHTLTAERQAAESGDLAALRTALTGLDGDFHTLVGYQRDVLTKVAVGSEAVAAPILAMMGSVQFQDITRQQIEQLTVTASTVGTRIAGIAAMLREAVDEPNVPDLSQLLDGLFKGYVMDGQRGAHLAAKGETAPEPAGLLIELF